MRRFQWVMDWVIDSRFRFGRGRHCFRCDNNLYWWNYSGENWFLMVWNFWQVHEVMGNGLLKLAIEPERRQGNE